MENAQNDVILDDVAGQAYVEQFGTETFQRADNAVRANKASRFVLLLHCTTVYTKQANPGKRQIRFKRRLPSLTCHVYGVP